MLIKIKNNMENQLENKAENQTKNTSKLNDYKELFRIMILVLNGLVFLILTGLIVYNKFLYNVNPDNFTMFTALTSLIIAFS